MNRACHILGIVLFLAAMVSADGLERWQWYVAGSASFVAWLSALNGGWHLGFQEGIRQTRMEAFARKGSFKKGGHF